MGKQAAEKREVLYFTGHSALFFIVFLKRIINKIEVIEKSIEKNTDKYEIKVKYPSIQGGEKEVTDKINKTIEDYTLNWINDIKLLGEEYSKEYEKE